MLSEQQRRANRRTAWVLAGMAALIAAAFVVNILMRGG